MAFEDSFCAIVDRTTYTKIIKRINQEKIANISRFLRQIDFMRNWSQKEILTFSYLMNLKTFEQPGQVILCEKKICDQVIIVKSGELEIVLQRAD